MVIVDVVLLGIASALAPVAIADVARARRRRAALAILGQRTNSGISR